MDETSSSQTFTYDVFLNFRGTDTRCGFVGHLHKALTASGINAFVDEENLETGAEIMPKLKEAIESSRIAITVISKDYASSPSCLTGLSYILNCFHGIPNRLILPVFYKVRPSDVKHQNGSYRKALANLDERFLRDMENWKEALRQVATLKGYCFENGKEYEYEFISTIVDQVSSKLRHGTASIHVADHLIRQRSQELAIRKLLDVASDDDDDDVHMIGIYGMGGVGKSTLASVVYNSINNQFESSCFLQNVREESNKHGLKHLQSVLLSQILGKLEINLASEQQGASRIQKRLKQKKVLLILDDVDDHKQLHGIVGKTKWFGRGSRVIITTRDKQLLASHGVESTYEVKKMKDKDALRLLGLKAFKTEQVDPSYNEVVNYVSGLPLALEIIGSNLIGKSIKEWESAIQRYKRIPNDRILEILKVSFDTLGEEEQSVFLDIACCMNGYKCRKVKNILQNLYGHCVEYHIGVLVEKSLIKIIDGRVTLHDLIEDMGKEIDRQKSPKKPGKRKRLWNPVNIIQVLKDNTGTGEIEIICGNFSRSEEKEKVELNENVFKKMKNLKVLIIKNGNFSQRPCLPASVKLLDWQETMS